MEQALNERRARRSRTILEDVRHDRSPNRGQEVKQQHPQIVGEKWLARPSVGTFGQDEKHFPGFGPR